MDEVEYLSALAMRSKAHWGYSTDFMAACVDELRIGQERLTSSSVRCTIAEQGQTITGYYLLERQSLSEWELEALFVDPLFIGQGIGRQLIEHAKSTVASSGTSSILIQSDPHAAGFYQNVGGRLLHYSESDSIPGRYLPVFTLDVSGDHES